MQTVRSDLVLSTSRLPFSPGFLVQLAQQPLQQVPLLGSPPGVFPRVLGASPRIRGVVELPDLLLAQVGLVYQPPHPLLAEVIPAFVDRNLVKPSAKGGT